MWWVSPNIVCRGTSQRGWMQVESTAVFSILWQERQHRWSLFHQKYAVFRVMNIDDSQHNDGWHFHGRHEYLYWTMSDQYYELCDLNCLYYQDHKLHLKNDVDRIWQRKWVDFRRNGWNNVQPSLGDRKLQEHLSRQEEIVLSRLHVSHTHPTHSYLMNGEHVWLVPNLDKDIMKLIIYNS